MRTPSPRWASGRRTIPPPQRDDGMAAAGQQPMVMGGRNWNASAQPASRSSCDELLSAHATTRVTEWVDLGGCPLTSPDRTDVADSSIRLLRLRLSCVPPGGVNCEWSGIGFLLIEEPIHPFPRPGAPLGPPVKRVAPASQNPRQEPAERPCLPGNSAGRIVSWHLHQFLVLLAVWQMPMIAAPRTDSHDRPTETSCGCVLLDRPRPTPTLRPDLVHLVTKGTRDRVVEQFGPS
jgi:hypothetical protein